MRKGSMPVAMVAVGLVAVAFSVRLPVVGIDGEHRDGVIEAVDDVGKPAGWIDGDGRGRIAGREQWMILGQNAGGRVEGVLRDTNGHLAAGVVIHHVGELAGGCDEDLKRDSAATDRGGRGRCEKSGGLVDGEHENRQSRC